MKHATHHHEVIPECEDTPDEEDEMNTTSYIFLSVNRVSQDMLLVIHSQFSF